MRGDASFVEALSYGMPPTAGWGCGIDRLVMLFSGLTQIRESILFPTFRSSLDLSKKAKKKHKS
jgi:lysyl-tRNA synthetase class 2